LKSLNHSLRNVSITGDYGYVPCVAVKTSRSFLINDLLPDFNIINTTNAANKTRQDKTRFYLYNLRHTGVQEDITNSHSI